MKLIIFERNGFISRMKNVNEMFSYDDSGSGSSLLIVFHSYNPISSLIFMKFNCDV